MRGIEDLFNVDDLEVGIPRALNNGIKGQVFHGDQSTFMIARFEPNMPGRIHKHPHEQWHFVLKGSCTRVHDGVEVTCKKGDFWVTHGGVMHTVVAGDDGLVLLDFFAPARDDYRQAGEGFGDSAYQTT
ncbi:MAG: cupin domain-containing protein [Chloroflexota bacterium]